MKTKRYVFISAALSLAIFIALSLVVTPKTTGDMGGTSFYGGKGFVAEPDNSLDCIVFGNSDAYSGFVPSVLYEKTGLSSYVSGVANQSMNKINTLLSSALQTQKPQIIILEADCLYTKSSSFYGRIDAATRLFQYHTRWKELKRRDFTTLPKSCGGLDPNKGYVYSDAVVKAENRGYMTENKESAVIPAATKNELSLFVETCKNNGVKVLIVKVPSTDGWSYKRSAEVKKTAASLGAEYLDLNDCADYKIDFNEDFRDGGNHQNINGAKKTTEYLGNILCSRYDVHPEEKNDAAKNEWFLTIKRANGAYFE